MCKGSFHVRDSSIMRPKNILFLVCLRFSLFNEIVILWVWFFLEDLNMINFVFEVY